MRKIQNIISIFTLTILCLSFVGCSKGCFANEHKWIYEKMSEIPIEYEGYYFEIYMEQRKMNLQQVRIL